MADSSQYNLSLVITANNKAVEELNKLGKSVDNVKGGITQLSESTKKTLKTIGATATVVAGSVVALGKTFVEASMEAEPLQRSFERLSESAQISSDEMLKAMRKASRGAVSDTKLMASANTALSLGVVKSADDMATLMEIARVKGQAMGRSMEEALDDIVRGLGRNSPMILDNLGIVIKQAEAQEEYAKQLGKTVDQLTEAEKKQALVNAVVKQGKEELAEAGEVPMTMAEKISALNTQRENMKVQIGNALLPVLSDLLEKITPIIQKIVARVEENPKLTANILLVVGAVSGLVAVLSGLALILPTITTALGVLSGPIGRIIAGITALAVAWKNNRGGIQDATKNAVDRIEKIIGPRLDKIKARREEHGETVMIYVEEIMGAIADTIGQTLSMIATLIAGTFETISSAFQLFKALWNGDRESVSQIAVERAVNIDNLLTESFGQTRVNIKTGIQEFYDRVVSKFNALYDKIQSIVAKIKNAWNSASEKVSGAVSSAVSFISGKASGGDVYRGQTYLVGEHGPELFTPSVRGAITPTNQITNNNGIEINMNGITVRSEADIQTITDEIIRKIKLEKNYGII